MLEELLLNRSLDPNALTVSVLLVTVGALLFLFRGPRKLDLPVLGNVTDSDFRAALEEGNKIYPDMPWIMPTPMHPTVVLPPHMVNEIKNLPEDQISLRRHHYTIFSGQYTKFGEPADELDAAIRVDLTRAADKQLEAFQDEVVYAFSEHIGYSTEFKAAPLYQAMLKVVSLLSSRVFVGLPMSRDKDWVETTAQYTVDGAMGAHTLSAYPQLIRPLVAPFVMKSVKMHRARARRMMQSLLDRFTTEEVQGDEEGGNLIAWILRRYNGHVTAERLARDQLIATFVAIHTTTICLTGTLFDLAARPEYLQPLRDELDAVLDLDPERKLNKITIHKLSKMDSFIKESQRLNPPGLVTMLRHVTSSAGLKLSSGQTIPYGYTISINNHAINMEHGTDFDGMRFHKMREQPGHEQKHQLVTTGTDSIAFGHGDHSCPGRFFAANEIKVIIAHLLLNYDIKLPGDGSRPENLHRGATVTPPQSEVLFRLKA